MNSLTSFPAHVPPRGSVLVFAPHGDDEVLGCGGALWMHAQRGDPVHVVVVFDGALGRRRGVPPESAGMHASGADATLVALRRAEARAAGQHLGPLTYEFLGLPEGHHPPRPVIARGADRLAERILALAPATVYAPWKGDGHRDHRTVSRGVRLALERACFRGVSHGYAVWTPMPAATRLDVTESMDARRMALAEHRTQGGDGELSIHMEAMALSLGLDQDGGPYAEVYCDLGPADPEDRDALWVPEAARGRGEG
jgi:LmbE family N-acetylglucosaminyl deacetylase